MCAAPANLLIDVGNSRIKYAFAAPDVLGEVQVAQSLDVLLAVMSEAQQVWLASVATPTTANVIAQQCTRLGIGFKQVHTSKQAFGINCAYQDEHRLGVDRWLSVLAARSMSLQPLAVISLGTATTCDFVIKQLHLGGWIAPGFNMMRESLVSGTQQVVSNNHYPATLAAGVETEVGVNMGCLAAQLGLVEQAWRYIQQQGDKPELYISGGGQSLISAIGDLPVTFVDNLVIRGLQRFLSAK